MNHKQKLKAFFHDPIDKAFNIQGHEKKALEYSSLAGIEGDLFDETTKNSDHIASAADRINFTENIVVDFNKKAELTHPLGSGRVNISDKEYGYINPDYKEIEHVASQTINEIKNKSKDEKTLLLNLWRNIPDKFKKFELEKYKLGNLWNLLPADTRIPDHSILDHNWLSSAVAGSLPAPAFLKFSIGPVQSFITSAKRTEDYWVGSYILSFLSARAIEVIIDEAGPEHIIYPYIKGQPLIDKFLKKQHLIEILSSPDSIKVASLSNIIFAVLPYGNTKFIAEKMRLHIQKSFNDLAKNIKDQFSEFLNDALISHLWKEQVENFIETYYTIYKWAGDITSFKQQYKQIFADEPIITEGKYKENIGGYWQCMYKISDSSFNSRKNLRNFKQLISKDALVKCSMCGEREVLRTNNIGTTKELTEFWKGVGEKNPEKIDIKGKDKLCAICFVKRMAGEYYFKKEIFNETDKDKINYPSTSTIAALPFKIKVIQNWQKTFPIIKNYNELLKQLNIKGNFNWNLLRHIPVKILYKLFQPESTEFREFADFLSFDGQWVYEESFTEQFLKDFGINFDTNSGIINSIKEAIKKLCSEDYGIDNKPSKYFAVISMDGDKMGQWLSGTHPAWPKWGEVVHSDTDDTLDEETKNKKRNLSPAVHSFISKSLNFFSLKLVRDIIEFDFPGKLIYSGGDDVLTFLPVDCALEASEKVRFTFSGNLNENREIDMKHTNGYILIKDEDGKKIIPTLGNNATMSAGIVIAHKNHDLSDVLRNVRDAEKQAKNNHDGDAFVIKILKHSGSITEYGAKWRKNDIRIIENMNLILKKVNDEKLSMSFFQSMFDDLEKIKYDNTDLTKSILRLKLGRHIPIKDKERKEKIKDELEKLFSSFIDKDLKHFLLTLRFLSTGGKR